MNRMLKSVPLALCGLIAALTSSGCTLEFRSLETASLEEGDQALAAGDLDAAWTAYSQCLTYNPRHFRARFNRALVFQRRGEYARAVDDLSTCLKQDDKSVLALTQRAKVRVEQKDFSGAIADCNEVLRLDPRDRNAHTNRGVAFAKQNDLAAARADFDEAVRRNADHPEFYMYSNLALACALSGDLRGAIANQTKAVELARGEDKEVLAAELREMQVELNPEI
jgi:tetratricopeptide (TPR) repeat protein